MESLIVVGYTGLYAFQGLCIGSITCGLYNGRHAYQKHGMGRKALDRFTLGAVRGVFYGVTIGSVFGFCYAIRQLSPTPK